MEAVRGLFCSRRLGTGSLPVVILMLLVQAFLGSWFYCPSYKVVPTIAYGLLCFLLPALLLFVLGLLFRTRRSPGLFSAKGCSCRRCLYEVGRAGKLPVFWILLAMIQGHNFECLMKPLWEERLRNKVNLYVQIGGLAGLVFLLILDYAVPQASCTQNCCIQFGNEDLVLEEVEVVLQQKVEEKRKAFLEDIIQSDLDRLTHEEFCKRGAVSDLVWKYKDIVLKKCAENGEGNLEKYELNYPK